MKRKKLLFFIILLVACLAQFGSDIYSSALPSIASDLRTSLGAIQISMAIYMLGVAIGQLVFGPLSDGLGRKMPLVIGLAICLLGSLICLSATSVTLLKIGRLIQGVGAGSCAAIWRSSFRDLFSGQELSTYGAYFAVFIVFIVPAAPTVGGYLTHYFSWRAIFIFLLIYTLFTWILTVWKFPETSKNHHISRLKWRNLLSAKLELLTSRVFIGHSICAFFSYGLFFSWFSVGPILLIHNLRMTPVKFGWINFIGGGIMIFLSSKTNASLVKKFGIPFMLRLGWGLTILSGLLMMLGYSLFGNSVIAIVIPILLFYFGISFIWPNTFAASFTPFGHIAGMAAAVYGAIQISGAAVLGGLLAFLPSQNALALAYYFILVGAGIWVFYEIFVKKNSPAS